MLAEICFQPASVHFQTLLNAYFDEDSLPQAAARVKVSLQDFADWTRHPAVNPVLEGIREAIERRRECTAPARREACDAGLLRALHSPNLTIVVRAAAILAKDARPPRQPAARTSNLNTTPSTNPSTSSAQSAPPRPANGSSSQNEAAHRNAVSSDTANAAGAQACGGNDTTNSAAKAQSSKTVARTATDTSPPSPEKKSESEQQAQRNTPPHSRGEDAARDPGVQSTTQTCATEAEQDDNASTTSSDPAATTSTSAAQTAAHAASSSTIHPRDHPARAA